MHTALHANGEKETERAREKENSRPQAFLIMVLQREVIKNRNI